MNLNAECRTECDAACCCHQRKMEMKESETKKHETISDAYELCFSLFYLFYFIDMRFAGFVRIPKIKFTIENAIYTFDLI